jgi:hypothetical protein
MIALTRKNKNIWEVRRVRDPPHFFWFSGSLADLFFGISGKPIFDCGKIVLANAAAMRSHRSTSSERGENAVTHRINHTAIRKARAVARVASVPAWVFPLSSLLLLLLALRLISPWAV